MPQIPRLTPRPDIEPARISPQSVGAPWGALAEAGERLERSSIQLGAIAGTFEYERHKEIEEDQKKQRIQKALEHDNWIADKFDQAEESFQRRTDYENFDRDSQKIITDLRNTYQIQEKSDPDLFHAIDRTFSQRSLNFTKKIRDFKREVSSQRALADFDRKYQRAIRDYGREINPLRQQIIKGELEVEIQSLVNSRIMNPVTGEKLINNLEQDTQEAILINSKSSDNRELIQATIIGIDKGAFPALDNKAQALYRSALKDRLRTIEKEDEARIDRKSVENTYSYLKTSWGDDYEQMYALLEDPGFLKKWDLTPERKNQLGNILHSEELRTKEIKVAKQHENGLKLLKDLNENALNITQINSAQADDTIDYEFGEKLKKRIETERKEKERTKTDPATFNRLNTLASEHPDREFVRKEIMRSVNVLEQSDFEKLLQRNQEKANTLENRARSEAAGLISNTVIPKRGMTEMFLSTPEEEYEKAEALRALDKAIEDGKATGKPLSYDDILKKGREIAQSYSKSIPERMQKMLEYTTKQMKPKSETLTDADISKILKDNGFEVTPENIKTFKNKNRIK